MGMWSEWRASRDRRRRASSYLDTLLGAPERLDGAWLRAMGVRDDVATREVTFAVRAIGLIVAERDALDDRTASDVAHQLAPLISREARLTDGHGREWGERWRTYTAALALRGHADAPTTRLARVLLQGAGIGEPDAAQVAQATAFVADVRARANEALRKVFGVAALPEDVRPSALRS